MACVADVVTVLLLGAVAFALAVSVAVAVADSL